MISYEAGKRIPHCELQIFKSNGNAARFMHQVQLLGVKDPFNYFVLSVYFSNQFNVQSSEGIISKSICMALCNFIGLGKGHC